MARPEAALWGANIRRYREKEGMRQVDLATVLHVCQEAVSRWERGHRAPKALHQEKMTRLFNVHQSVLFPVEETP